jgi:molybdate transport system permease protein
VLSAEDWQAVRLTLVVSAYAVGCALPLGVAIAVVLARVRFAGRFLLDLLVYLPLVVPPVVVGWMLLELFGVRGVFGAPLHRWFGLQLAFTTAGAALACGVMVLPLIVRATRISLEAIDPGLEQAARTLGAGRMDRFIGIVLPLAGPGLLVGVISAYAAAGRVRRGDHLRRQYSGGDADAAAGDLYRAAGAGRGGAGGAAVAGVGGAGAGRVGSG